VYALVRSIPTGRVLSYGAVAALLGHPRSARGVGTALAGLPEGHDVPWWRVVNRNGEITSPRIHHIATLQRKLLEGERVKFSPSGRIDMAAYAWRPDPESGC
jgi:methylated-DNA-protein-cysteine methyltransferase-like protein